MKRAWLNATKGDVYTLRVPCGQASKSNGAICDPTVIQKLKKIMYT